MNFFRSVKKLIFLWKKPKVIIVAGEGKACAAEAIFQVLKQHLKVRKISNNILPLIRNKNEILILEIDLADLAKTTGVAKVRFLAEKSSPSILVITHLSDSPPDQDFWASDRTEANQIKEIAKTLSAQGYLVLNFDDETAREIKKESRAHSLTFGFQPEADFQASDVRINHGVNFKINYQGNIVPVWLETLFGKEQIYAALASASIGTIFDLNLVEISQSLKSYQGLTGKMKLIKGIKNSWILDDSASATVFSMAEAVEILGKIEAKRKIAVLGDVIGAGKYTIEAHEAIGERVARAADSLFTFGPRGRLIAQGAGNKGMALEKIFQFDTLKEGGVRLQDEIKEGDLILVDGSKEMGMGKIVEEIKAQST